MTHGHLLEDILMTTSTFRIELAGSNYSTATRPSGQRLLDAIELMLGEVEIVEIDFNSVSPTPSFVDQCLGGFVKLHGLDTFKSRVRLLNVAEDARSLVRHVVLSRANETLHSAHTRGQARSKRRQSGFVDSKFVTTRL